MRAPRQTALNCLAILAVCAVIVIAFGGCGGGGSDGGTGGTGETNGQTDKGGTPHDTANQAFATGQEQCRVGILGKVALVQQFGSHSLPELAHLYSEKIYTGFYPNRAADGCLKVLKTGK
jgi:hypothetical protein